jgi:hypothetical protein
MNSLQWLAVALGLLVVIFGGFSAWLWFGQIKKSNRSVVRLPDTDPTIVRKPQSASKIYLTYGEADAPLAELESFALRKGEQLTDLPETTGLPFFLNPLLQRLPELFNKGSEALGFVYRVKFSPEITRGLLTGTSKLLQTSSGTLKATAVNATGSQVIQGGANVIATAANPAAIVLIMWQVAAIVTAQKYLADINQKLKAIGSQLGEVLGLLQGQMFAKLKAYVTQLEMKFSTIKRGALSESDFNSFGSFFDSVEHHSISIMETAKDEMLQSRKKALAAAANKDKSALLNQCESLDTYSRLWSAAAYTRLLATQVNSLLPVDQISVAAAVTDMSSKLETFSSDRHEFLRQWRQKKETNGKSERLPIFRSKQPYPGALWPVQGRDHRQVVKSLLRCNKLAKDRESQLLELFNITDRMLAERAQRLSHSIEIRISLDPNGAITSAQLIEPSSNGEQNEESRQGRD